MITWRILLGDVRDRLRELREASVQCVVTSPPYWGLRDYGTARWEGGDPACAHAGRPKPRQDTSGTTKRFTDTRGTQPAKCAYSVPVREECPCGARRIDAQIGLELTLADYVEALVEVFREVRRVLRPDGTLWLNLGDCYAHDGKWGGETGGKQSYLDDANRKRVGREKRHTGLKAKDLVGVPWEVAFALRADGWYLRCDIVWHKPNGLPESVKDRPTKHHEYVFLLTKSARYFYDADAVKEPYAESTLKELAIKYHGEGRKDYAAAGVQNPSDVKRRIVESAQKNQTIRDRRRAGVNEWDNPNRRKGVQAGRHEPVFSRAGRNRRSVWSIHTQPFPDAHFAVMPEALVEPCILAGSREGDTVLDPFAGSGTVGVVAVRHQRHFIGCELNPAYVELARKRIGSVAPLLATEVA